MLNPYSFSVPHAGVLPAETRSRFTEGSCERSWYTAIPGVSGILMRGLTFAAAKTRARSSRPCLVVVGRATKPGDASTRTTVGPPVELSFDVAQPAS